MAVKELELKKKYYSNFGGGINNYLGPRKIKDNESPYAINCDFIGDGGIVNREGYSELGTVGATYNQGIYGLATFRTASENKLIKFASDGSNVVLNHSEGSAWTAVTGTKFTNSLNMDVCQAAINTTSYLFSGNGTDNMAKFDGTVWSSATNGTKGFFPTYFSKRLWVADETNLDTLNFSAEYNDATNPLQFTGDHDGTITFRPGSGEEIKGMIVWQTSLYVFMQDSIWQVTPTTTADTFTVTLVTKEVGTVSHRSICQVGNDIMFAADDGVYSFGEVANYTTARTTNKSARVQKVFDAISSTNKSKLVGRFHNFKYHLFYSLNGTENDSCLVYDIRYGGWQDWRNMGANDAVVWTNSSDSIDLYFGHPSNGKVFKMYDGTDDDGTSITATWRSKSFDEGMMDVVKLYFDTTVLFGALNGTATIKVIFNDTEITATKTLSQQRPAGGLGYVAYGRKAYGSTGTVASVDIIAANPYRLRAKGQKFAIQYEISSSGKFQLDAISQTFIPFVHYKFPSNLKIN